VDPNGFHTFLLDAVNYARMIYHGFGMLDRFPRDRPIRHYQRAYNRVCR
jgi:hypothetical protein